MTFFARQRFANVAWTKWAVAAWTLVALAITIRLLTAQNIARHSVYPSYIGAARLWVSGADLYGPVCPGFRYSPLFAVAFTPFTAVSDRAGNIVWRWLNFAAYLGALGWWMRCVLRERPVADLRGLFLLLVIPLSVGSLNNGQSNPLMTALMLSALASVHERRWMLASVLLAFAIHLKLYPLALALTLLALWPRELGWRLALILAGSVALCFLAQSPGYVAAQFAGWFLYLSGDLRLDQPPQGAYRDLRLLLDVVGIKPSHVIYFALQLAGAGAVAFAGLKMKAAAMPPRRFLALVYALVASWILLLGPATESCTYILLAPALAWLLLEAWTGPRPVALRAALVVCCVLLLGTMMANWFPIVTKVHGMGLHPLATLIFLGCVIDEAFAPVLRPERDEE